MGEENEFSRLVSVKKCPNCGGKLEKGYFNAPVGIYWDIKKHGSGRVFADAMLHGIVSDFALDNAPALRCKRCGIAVLDYGLIGETPRNFLKKCVQCGKEIPIASEYCPECGAKQKESVTR